MLSVLAVLAASAAPPTLHWSWPEDGSHRFYIENEVHLPAPVMIYQEMNTQARLVAFQSQLVLDCAVAEERNREWELACTIEDISLVGATMPGDRGNMTAVLQETDERLTGAVLQVMLRKDGHIRHVDLENVDRRNRRLSSNAETLRLLLVRALAGLDFRFARDAEDESHGWAQFNALLMDAPYNRGSQGSSELVNRVTSETGDLVVVETAGRGVTAPATDHSTGPANTYRTELSSRARFDRSTGVMQQRMWTVVGEPTAGSAVADGTDGVDYLQAGSLVYLAPGADAPELRESHETAAPNETTLSAITGWVPIPALQVGR